MDGVSSISGLSGGQLIWPNQTTSIDSAQPTGSQTSLAGMEGATSDSLVAVNSLSISQTAETFVGEFGAAMNNDELLGAVMLLLLLEYLKSDDEEEKKALLGLMTALAEQQNGQNGGGMFMYSSSSMNIESTQILAVSSDTLMNAYGGGDAINVQQAPPSDPGSGSLNITA